MKSATNRVRATGAALLGLGLLVTAPLLAQDGSFARDGVRLHYRTAGAGTPIVFLSGGPGFDEDYMVPVADFVPASYQRVFYQQRGTGQSRLATTAEDIHDTIPASSVEYIRQCGHFPWIEQPEEFRRILTDFFTSERDR
jgi:pimeloyl-ACP methyl ester carboxylesterase